MHPGSRRVILDVVVRHYGRPDSATKAQSSSGLLCTTSWASNKDSPPPKTEKNSTMEAYLCAFVNFEQNGWANLLPMAKFACNNAKIANMGYAPFELNCG